jgi:hypothetical protein
MEPGGHGLLWRRARTDEGGQSSCQRAMESEGLLLLYMLWNLVVGWNTCTLTTTMDE